MNTDANLEILSKIVIQLKTSQTEFIKNFTEEIAQIKATHSLHLQDLRDKNDNEVMMLKEQIAAVSQKLADTDLHHKTEIAEMKTRFEKSIIEMREDMLRLLKKYEDKFNIQDDEIENLKEKCEMANCSICNYRSFKIHFLFCEGCQNIICSNCLLTCKPFCKKLRCLNCLRKCNNCNENLCTDHAISCDKCKQDNCKDCFAQCHLCNCSNCLKCLYTCHKCSFPHCNNCSEKCEKCGSSVACKVCFEKDSANEKCVCGKLFCFNCEDDCSDCTIPSSWMNECRVFQQGFHTKSSSHIPNKCLVKFFIINKGIGTTHLGLTSDCELIADDHSTENFWSLCLNSGEKFSTSDYKKNGMAWGKYAIPVKTNDTVYMKVLDSEVRFLINRKEYPVAFYLDRSIKYFLYCLTHNDSTKIEIKSMKVYK